MKHIFLFFSLVLLYLGGLHAQTVDVTAYSSFFSPSASRNRPAALGTGTERVNITLTGMSAGASNSLISRGMITRLAQGDFTHMPQWMSTVQENETFQTDATLQLLSGSVTLGPKGGKGFSFGWGVADRFQTRGFLPGSLLELAWQGNAAYEDQTVKMNFGFNGSWMREYAVGFAMPLSVPGDKWQLRLGGRAKYLQGIAAFQTNKANLSLYTAPNGEYLDVSYDYSFQTSFDPQAAIPFASSNISHPSGKGIGYDLGFQVGYGKFFKGELNVLDAGAVNFQAAPSLVTYAKADQFRFQGIVLDNAFEGSPTINSDFIDSIAVNNRITGQAMRYQLPSRVRAQVTFQVPAKTLKGVTYPMHSATLAYTDYFAKTGGANLEAAYTFNLLNLLEATALAGTGPGHRYAGAFVGVRASAFRLGFGSRDLSAILSSNAKGGSADFILALGF